MSEGNHLKFNFVPDHIGDANISVQLENNLASWLNHGFLEMGGWVNIATGTASYYGGSSTDLSRLQAVKDPNYPNYTIWQGFRKDWVYESGGAISYPSGDPIVCSGVYIGTGNNFYPSSTTGAYAHRINFPAGRIEFVNSGAVTSGAIGPNTIIRAAYSYRLIQIYKANKDWQKTIQYYSLRADNSNFVQFGSGTWDIDWRNRLQLPGIVVELIPRKDSKPWQLGTLAAWEYQTCAFHIYAEDDYWCGQIRDIIANQHDRSIFMYDVNMVEDSGAYPLTAYGTLNPSGKLYPTLVEEIGNGGFRYKVLRLTKVQVSEMKTPHPNLHGAVVRTSLEYIT